MYNCDLEILAKKVLYYFYFGDFFVIYVNSQAAKTVKLNYLLNKLLRVPLRNSYNFRYDFH
jgi:hypothetical protein